MTNLLLRLFVKQKAGTTAHRESIGGLAGWVGLVTNFILFLIKLLSGLFTGSISIMTDAINNLSDSSSSLITMIGFKLSAMPADEEHPYGHARFEQISGLLVSCIIVLIGGQFLITSVKRTINPQPMEFSLLIAILLVLSIFAKLWQGLFYKKLGKKIDSAVLLATAVDSRNDVITTIVVLISCIIQHFTGWMLDGPMGILVSLFVVYSGIALLRDTLTPLIGAAPRRELVDLISGKINSYSSVLGTHDIIVHNYGAGAIFATAHAEVSAEQDILVSHDIIDNIERDFLVIHGIHLVIHLDPIITDDPQNNRWLARCKEILNDIDPILSLHDFRMVEGLTHSNLIFDMTVPPRYRIKNAELRRTIQAKVTEIQKDAYVVITIDRSYISYIE